MRRDRIPLCYSYQLGPTNKGLRLSLALYGSIYVGTGRGVPDKTGPAIQEVNTNSTMEKTCTLKQGPLEMIHLQKKNAKKD